MEYFCEGILICGMGDGSIKFVYGLDFNNIFTENPNYQIKTSID